MDIRAIGLELVGLMFAAIAGYGLVTGNLTPGAEETALAVSGVYLGIKLPAGT